MTREEAITALGDRNCLLWGMSKEEQKYYSEALDMAISALSAEGEYIKKTDVLDKAVIETLSDYTEHDVIHVDEINKLPTYSVPEREKGTKYYKADDVIKALLDNGYGDEENGADPEYMTALSDVRRGLDNISVYAVPEGKTYGEKINFYLKSLVETYKRMGYIITEISITEKNSLSPTIYEFGETEREVSE